MKMDHKYKGSITKNDGTPVPDDEWIVFRAKDIAVLPMLETYYETCSRLGADQVHLDGVRDLIGRVHDYQKVMPSNVPDTKPGELEHDDFVADRDLTCYWCGGGIHKGDRYHVIQAGALEYCCRSCEIQRKLP